MYVQMPESNTWYSPSLPITSVTEIKIVTMTDDTVPELFDLEWQIGDGGKGGLSGTVLYLLYDEAAGYNGFQLAQNSNKVFAFFSSLETITGAELLNTSNVEIFSRAFQACVSLKSIDVSNWDTTNVTDMSYMFQGCVVLPYIDVSNWNVHNVTTLAGFIGHPQNYNNNVLTALDVSNWDITNCKSLNNAFTGNTALTTLNVIYWDTSKVEDMAAVFAECQALDGLDISNWDTSSCTTMQSLFYNCRSLTTLDVSRWKTGKVTDMRWTFAKCLALKNLDISNWDTSSCTTMRSMFSGENYGNPPMNLKLVGAGVSNWNTGNVTNMDYMFYGCRLGSIDVSKWNVSKVTSFDHFLAHSYITINGVENWVTSSAENFNAMFHTAQNTSLDVSNFVTSKVKTFCQMFENMFKMESIVGLENFDTSSVLDFQQMFQNCKVLKKLNLSSFDTTHAKDGEVINVNGSATATLYNMFADMKYLEEVVLGDKFSFNGDGTTTDIKNFGVLPLLGDGYWYTEDLDAYKPNDIPNGAGVYYSSRELANNTVTVVKRSSLRNIADAFRDKLGEEKTFKPSEMATSVSDVYKAGADSQHFSAILHLNGGVGGTEDTEENYDVLPPFRMRHDFLLKDSTTVMFGVNGSEPGFYYLNSDISLVDTVRLSQGIVGDINRDICLDLNGHTLTAPLNKPVFKQDRGTTLHIYDSMGGGKIVGNGTVEGSGGMMIVGWESHVHVYGGTFTGFRTTECGGVFCLHNIDRSITIHGGTFSNNHSKVGGVFHTIPSEDEGVEVIIKGGLFTGNEATTQGTIYSSNKMNLIIEGGKFTGNSGSSLIMGAKGTLTMSGGEISGNGSSAIAIVLNTYDEAGTGKGEAKAFFSGSAVVGDCGVSIAAARVGHGGASSATVTNLTKGGCVSIHHYSAVKSVTTDDTVVSGYGTYACIGDIPVGHEDRKAVSGVLADLPEGSYWLAGDTTLSSSVETKGKTGLCLNGHKLSAGSNLLLGATAADLSICDCKGGGEVHLQTNIPLIGTRSFAITLKKSID